MINLILGDSLEVMRGMKSRGEKVDVIFADPPYGVNFQSNARKEKLEKIANDDSPYIWWLRDAYELLNEGGRLICFCDQKTDDIFKQAITWAGFTIKNKCIWSKNRMGMGDLQGQMGLDYEIFFYATKGRYTFKNGRPRSIFTVTQQVTTGQDKHPNEKPVELAEQILEAISSEGETILDPFLGRGTSMRAAKNKNRNGIGIELLPNYYAMAERLVND